MIKEAIGTGATIEAAIEAAKLALDAPADADVTTEVLETPSKKLLKTIPAKVRAYYEESEFHKAEQYIKTVLRLMGVGAANVLTVEEDDGVRFSLDCGENDGYVIGRRGETLDSLQYLVRLVVSRGSDDYRRVTVNVGDYRETREANLRDLAIATASKAKKYGRNMSLPPMSPYDRRTIHTTVQEIEGVSSFSVGEGGERRVVVAPDEQYRRADNRRSGGYDRDRDNRGSNLQRNQRNAQNNRRFPGDDNRNNFRRDDNRPPRSDGYRNDNYRSNDGYRRDDRRPPRSNAPAPQPSRPPRSDASGAGRYGKIEPRRAEQEAEQK